MSDPEQALDFTVTPDPLDAGLAAGFGPAGGGDEFVVQPGPPSAGRYQFFGELARGGMGVVLKAHDPDLGRDLAVKVLRAELLGRPAAVNRFLEEAQVGGQLQHPGCVPVYELGALSDGRPYFAMKLIEGRTLADLLKERPAPGHDLPRFVQVFEQVCQTVAYAHSKGVIHRDLKPANVMVGAFGEVQVMDWGLAKVLPRGGAAEPPGDEPAAVRTVRSGEAGSDTQAGAAVGTPAFMPPEQAAGDVDRVDERADVFGLGGILCAILTGQPPFAGRTPEESRSKAQVGDLAETFARLDGCRADGDLVALARACLAADPTDRPRNAAAVAAAAGAYRQGMAERARQAELDRAAAEARAGEERKRRRWQLALAGALLLAVGLGGGWWGWAERQLGRTRVAAAERDAAAAAALGRAAEARDAGRWLEARALMDYAEQRLAEGGPDELREQARQARADLEVVFDLEEARLGGPQLQADQLQAQADGFDEEARARAYAAAFARYGIPVSELTPADAADRIRRSAVMLTLITVLDDWAARADRARGDRAQADRLWEVARVADADPWRQRLREIVARRDLAAVRRLAREPAALTRPPVTLAMLGALLGAHGGEPEAATFLREALARYPSDFWLNELLGITLISRGPALRPVEAEAYLRAAVAVRPQSSGALLNLGAALGQQGRPREAEAAYRVAVRLKPDSARAHGLLGIALADQERLPEAVAALREAIRLEPDEAVYPSNLAQVLVRHRQIPEAEASARQALRLRPDMPEAHFHLGLAQVRLGLAREAEASYRRAFRLRPAYFSAVYNLGILLFDQGRLPEAEAAYRQAIGLERDNSKAHYGLGLALARQGRHPEAEAEGREAIRLKPDYADAHCMLGLALWNQGRFTEALVPLRRAHELGPKQPNWRHPTATWIRDCERLRDLDGRLLAVLAGLAFPASARERLELADLCLRYKKLNAAAARFAAAAFAAEPKLEEPDGRRYTAARAAALAAAGRGADVAGLTGADRARLRRQALDWLRADLAARQKRAGDGANREQWRKTLARWQQDAELAGVRDPAVLAKLPPDERAEWERLWREVAAALERAR